MMVSVAYLYCITNFVQALFCGIFIITFVQCIRWLLFANRGWTIRDRVNRPLLVISCCIFVLTVSNFAIFSAIALSYVKGEVNHALTLRIVLAPVESMTVILADCILIYRCWVTYAYKWKVVVLPIFLWVAYIVFSVLFLYTSTYQLMHETPITLTINRLYKVSIGACFICTIGINSYATSFIIFRIWNLANRTTEPPDRRNLTLTIRIIAESGLLYTITSILALITGMAYLGLKNTSSSIASSIFAAINLNMTGIAFNLLLIRVALNRTSASTSSSLRQSIPMFNLEHDDSNTSQERIPDSTDDPMKARAPADANV